jgi:hypothetical protein
LKHFNNHGEFETYWFSTTLVKTASGRIDTLVEIGNYVYCFEFKLDGTADQALRQIDTKDYLMPWRGEGKTLVKVGVPFNSKKTQCR